MFNINHKMKNFRNFLLLKAKSDLKQFVLPNADLLLQ